MYYGNMDMVAPEFAWIIPRKEAAKHMDGFLQILGHYFRYIINNYNYSASPSIEPSYWCTMDLLPSEFVWFIPRLQRSSLCDGMNNMGTKETYQL